MVFKKLTNMRKNKILISGVTGFIGSHTAVELIESGHSVIGVDNLSNSSADVVDRIYQITDKKIDFSLVDIRDYDSLDNIFKNNVIDAVIHFAGYKAVGESVKNPMLYYSNNLKGTITLLEIMNRHDVTNLVFSSSCTVYGNPESVPVTELTLKSPVNPYGRTKAWIDEILNDLSVSNKEWSIISLRYFNPIGAHSSSLIGEDPLGKPNNLVPFITQVAVGRRKKLSVFGDDYPTKDGTCIRDYIHVVDLARGHTKAIEKVFDFNGCEFVNLGTGKGHSVLEVVNTFQQENNVDIDYEIVGRRPGDASEIYADPSKARRFLDWKAEKSLNEMLKDAWNFQQKNPNGYK